MHEQKQIYSLRKLSVGLASVIVGTCFFISNNGQQVKADTVNVGEQQTSTVIQQDSSKKQEQDSNEQNDQTNVSNSKTEQQQSTNEQNDVENVETTQNNEKTLENISDSAKAIDENTSKTVTKSAESENNQKFDQIKNQLKQELNNNKDLNKSATPDVSKETDQAQITQKDDTTAKTNTLNVIKASQAPIAENMLKEDKTEVKENQDWADPAKQGFHKTTAGWTKLQQGKGYDAVANNISTTITYMNSTTEKATKVSGYINHNIGDAGITFHVNIDKKDIVKNKNILLTSIPVLHNYDPNKQYSYISNGDGSINRKLYDKFGHELGSIIATTKSDPKTGNGFEYDFLLNVTSDDKFASNLDFTYNIPYAMAVWNSDYRLLKDVSIDKTLKYNLITPQDKRFELDFNINKNYSMSWWTPIAHATLNTDNNPTFTVNPTWYDFWDPTYSTIGSEDNGLKDLATTRVVKITPNEGQKLSLATVYNRNIWYWVNDKGQFGNQLETYHDVYCGQHKLGDNLTADQVLAQTPDHSVGYSEQSDGSLVIAYKLHNLDFKASKNDLDNAINPSYFKNIQIPGYSDADKAKIINATEDYYAKHNYSSTAFSPVCILYFDKAKPCVFTITDLTPNKTHFKGNTTEYMVSGTKAIDTTLIKPINIKYIDDTDPNNKLSSDVKTFNTDDDLTLTIGKDFMFPSSYELSDSQPDLTKFNYDPTTKTFHYGVVKDTNPDIVIHVKHKIVKGVSGDDKMLDNYPNIKKALNASIKLVANYTYPDNGKFTDERAYPKQRVNSLTLKRSADVDLTTDSIISGTTGAWSAVNQNGIAFNNGLVSSGSNFGEILPKGYTLQNGSDTTTNAFNTDAFQTSARNAFADLRNTGGSVTKAFNYVIKADPQKIQVKFVDDDDPNKAQVGDIIIMNGVTDGQADFKDTIAAYNQDQAKYYVLAKDQTDPNALKHTFIANDSTVLTVHLKHQHAKSTVQSPATRTIVVHMPDGTTKTYVQTIGFVNNLDKDLVTNKTTNIYTVDASKSNVTVNGTVDSSIGAYRKTGNDYKFASFVLPKIPGYKAVVKTVANPVNPASALFAVSFMALPKPATSVPNNTKPAETVSPATPVAIEVAKPIKTEPKVTIFATPKAIDLSNDAVTTTPDVSTWQVADEPDQDTYHVSNGKYAVELPHISNAQLHVIANDSTKDSILFGYKGQNSKYVFKIKFVNGHYLLTTYKIKSGKLVKLIDYNFIKSSKMIDVILDWLQLE